jgi:hypothetical protein
VPKRRSMGHPLLQQGRAASPGEGSYDDCLPARAPTAGAANRPEVPGWRDRPLGDGRGTALGRAAAASGRLRLMSGSASPTPPGCSARLRIVWTTSSPTATSWPPPVPATTSERPAPPSSGRSSGADRRPGGERRGGRSVTRRTGSGSDSRLEGHTNRSRGHEGDDRPFSSRTPPRQSDGKRGANASIGARAVQRAAGPTRLGTIARSDAVEHAPGDPSPQRRPGPDVVDGEQDRDGSVLRAGVHRQFRAPTVPPDQLRAP